MEYHQENTFVNEKNEKNNRNARYNKICAECNSSELTIEYTTSLEPIGRNPFCKFLVEHMEIITHIRCAKCKSLNIIEYH